MNEMPVGIEAGKQLTENIISRFTYTLNKLKEVEDKSIKLLTIDPIFLCEEDFLFIKNNLEILIGEKGFDDFQKEIISNYYNEIKSVISSSIALNLVKDNKSGLIYIQASITLNDSDYPIVNINPFFKTITIAPDNNIDTINEKINECNKALEELKEYEKKLTVATQNPVLLSDNPLDMLNRTFKKKKYKKEITDDFIEVSKSMADYNLQIRKYESMLDSINVELLTRDDLRDDIINTLTNRFYNFIFIDKIDIEKEDILFKSMNEIDIRDFKIY